VGGPLSMVFYGGAEAHLDSNFIQNISNRQLCRLAHGRDRYPGSDGGVMLGFSRNFARSCGGRWHGERARSGLKRRDSSATPTRSGGSRMRLL